MSQYLGTGVSFTYDENNYNQDLVVFQKEKPILDSELNYVQQLQNVINRQQNAHLSSGWLTMYPFYTDRTLSNAFYTQNPSSPHPEVALVNGMPVYVSYTGSDIDNVNKISLGAPPTTGNRVNGIFLEVWRALLSPGSKDNKPDPATIVDSMFDIFMFNQNVGWICGQNGSILTTANGGTTWTIQSISTTKNLNGVFFINNTIGWVVGNNGVLARTASGGAGWNLLTSPTTENLNAVHGLSQSALWAVGDAGVVLKSLNGTTWAPQTSGVSVNLNKVYFHSILLGWAVGDNGTILRTTNGGNTWLQMTSGTTQNLNGVFFYDANYGFAVGDNGTILRSSDGGGSWVNQSGQILIDSAYTTISNDLHDIHMIPTLDLDKNNEEVSSQMTGSNKNFTLSQVPVTKGDGFGTITNDPQYITVNVQKYGELTWSQVAVDILNGTTGAVVLAVAPGAADTVLVSYHYKACATVFVGKAWIVGSGGEVLYTDDIGATWLEGNSNTTYDLYGIDMVNKDDGWLCGAESVIRKTVNGGVDWTVQQSQTIVRSVERVYSTGNIAGSVYLNDNSIHPDANVETTKRVQVQYKIRVVSDVDPDSNPDAGLSSSIIGFGPNSSGLFSYENMGAINGDYGLWRAKCNNTVDGYCYAIPMFFVSRRNTTIFKPAVNANGGYQPNTSNIRLDLLAATVIADGDILDVRRKVVIPSLTEILERGFDDLSANNLKTKFFRKTGGGDRYGTELLQVDRIGGSSTDGGDPISGVLADVASDGLSSEASKTRVSVTVPFEVSTPPVEQALGSGTMPGYYSADYADYLAVYDSPGSVWNGKTVPGYFEGVGTSTPKFVFSSSANTQTQDPNLQNYIISGVWIQASSAGLTYVPTNPQLVRNFSGASSFYYHGILETDSSRVIESWPSGVSGYNNFVVGYAYQDSSAVQQYRASPLELHYYMKLDSSKMLDSTTITMPKTIYPNNNLTDVPYSVFCVSHVNSAAGAPYKISNVNTAGDPKIYSESGYPFTVDTVVKVTSYVESGSGNGIRNGAVVGFTGFNKGVRNFCSSDSYPFSLPISDSSTIINLSNKEIIGISIIETSAEPNQMVCWKKTGTAPLGDIQKISSVLGLGTGTVTLYFPTTVLNNETHTIQLLVRDTVLPYVSTGDGLLIGYMHTPYQSVASLPTSMSLDIVEVSRDIYVANSGTGASSEAYPYDNPIEQIPVNNSTITTEGIFTGDKLRFNNFVIDSGLVKLPVLIPGSFGSNITLSGISTDAVGRFFYNICSKEVRFTGEGLTVATARKVYLPVLARVSSSADGSFHPGEYVMLVFSRVLTTETENTTGWESGKADAVAVYRLPNKPLSKV